MARSKSEAAGPPERERYRHGDLKRALVAAGLELARAGGPDSVVLREATRQAGVVPNAAYRHFASRDELLEAVRSAALAELATAIEGEIRAADQMTAGAPTLVVCQARFGAVGAGYLRFAREQPGLFRTAFAAAAAVRETDATPERAGPGGLNPFQLLGATLDDLMRAGALPAERREGAEYLAWSAVHGMAMLLIDGPMARLPVAETEILGQRLLAMVIRGI